MKKIMFAMLAVILVLGTLATGCGEGPCIGYDAPIEDVVIWADNSSSPTEYFLDVIYGFSSCDGYSGSYKVKRVGNTSIEVDIFNGTCEWDCTIDRYGTHNISMGSDFVMGLNYTVEINDVTVNFVPGVIMIYPATVLDVQIWADGSLPQEYFVDVKTEEPSTCDQFDSYNVTRTGNTTIIIDIFNRRCCTGCFDSDEYYLDPWHTIPLGSDFVTGVNYTVEVNDVTDTFVA